MGNIDAGHFPGSDQTITVDFFVEDQKWSAGAADLHFSPNISHKCLWRSCGRAASSPKWILCELREPFSFYNKAQLYKGFTIFPIWNVCDSLSCAVLWKCCRLRDHFTLMFNLIECVSVQIKARGRASPSSCARTPSHVLFSPIILLNATSVTTTHITLPRLQGVSSAFYFFPGGKNDSPPFLLSVLSFLFLFFRPELNVSKSETAFLCLISPLVHHALSRLFSTSLSSCW